MKSIFMLSTFLLLSACTPSQEEEQMEVDAASSREIIKRASLDLKCPIADISAKRVAGAIVGNLQFGAPNGTWVAEGCGNKGTYQVMCSLKPKGWNNIVYDCNPMLESMQSSVLMQNNASTVANVAAQQAAQQAAAQAQQRQQQYIQQQQQQAEAFRKQQQQSMQRRNESQRQSDAFRKSMSNY